MDRIAGKRVSSNNGGYQPLLDDPERGGAAPKAGSKLGGKTRSGKELWSIARRRTVEKKKGAFRRLFGPQRAMYPVHKDHTGSGSGYGGASPPWRRKLRRAQIKMHLLLEKSIVEKTMLSLVVIDVLIMLFQVVLDLAELRQSPVAPWLDDVEELADNAGNWIDVVFCLETFARVFALGWDYFRHVGNWLDLVVNPLSVYFDFFAAFATEAGFIGLFRFWRFFQLSMAQMDLQAEYFEAQIEALEKKLEETEKQLRAAKFKLGQAEAVADVFSDSKKGSKRSGSKRRSKKTEGGAPPS